MWPIVCQYEVRLIMLKFAVVMDHRWALGVAFEVTMLASSMARVS
jgi:hypothetical protein